MTIERSDLPRHPIRVVSRRTGLSPAVLRAWEKRYHVVDPSRTDGGQRLYSDEDVRRLTLLRRAVEEGRNISRVADLTVEELVGMIEEDEAGRRGPAIPQPLGGSSPGDLLEQGIGAVLQMDPVRLERILTRGAMALPIPVMLDQVVAPILNRIGTSWQEGRLGPAQEHLASVVIRRFLEWLLNTVSVGSDAPVLVTATPVGERHELGALLAAVSGAAEGWRSVFLGPDLPPREIAAAAATLKAEVVALSCVDPAGSARLSEEVKELRALLPERVRILLGGAVAQESLESEGIEVLGSLESLRWRLRAMALTV